MCFSAPRGGLLTCSLPASIMLGSGRFPLVRGSRAPVPGSEQEPGQQPVALTRTALLCAGQVSTAGVAEILNGYTLKSVLRKVPGEKHTESHEDEDEHDDSYLGESYMQPKHTHARMQASKQADWLGLFISKSMITVIPVRL